MCITGMPGAGKSTVATILHNDGFSVITMGDVIREEAIRQNLEMNDSNLGNLMLNLRKNMGPAAVAYLILKKMQREANVTDGIVIDGIRNVAEVNVLEKMGQVKLLAVHASADMRYKHIKERGRSDVAIDHNDFKIRDKRELDIGISEAIALSDEVVSNNNLTKDELRNKVLAIVRKWTNKINNKNIEYLDGNKK
ncbi:MAG: AAA family ATPase [Nitrososphaeraceae archaeon]